jgi:sugar/nucleoside kinase (ribokinase family)
MSLVVVGTVAFDTIETPYDRREDVLGGSATHFAIAASYFGPVGLVGVVGEDFPEGPK